jgi:hydroxymethylglutaryl-CoA lyase
VRIVEVGPRDGLQSEPVGVLPINTRIEFVNMLSDSGLTHIEVASFVSPEWIPAMADSGELVGRIDRNPKVTYSALVPNLKGFQRAMDAGIDEVVVFTSATESFAQNNLNCSIRESIDRYTPVMDEAKKTGIPVRGAISVVLGCPYEGDVRPEAVAEVAKTLYEMGCYEISLCDTIGTGTPIKAKKMIEAVAQFIPVEKLAAHFHDTYSMALTNLYAVLEEGVSVIDSSAGGLGGCPYTCGVSENVATEDVLYMLDGLGIETGVNLDRIISAGNFITGHLGRQNGSKVARVRSAKNIECN